MPDIAEAPPAPAATPAPAAPASNKPAPGANLNDAFANLEKYAKPAGIDQSAIPPAPAQKKTEPKPKAEVKPPVDTTAVEDTPVTDPTPSETPKPAEVVPSKVKKPADFLRDELGRWKSKAEAYEQEISKLKTPVENPEIKSLTEKFESEAKARKAIEDELRFVNYERHPEYKEKYQKPLTDSWNNGRAEMLDLKVLEKKNEMDEVIRPARRATAEDFDAIMNLPTAQALDLIDDLFGQGAANHTAAAARKEVIGKVKAAEQALEDHRKNGSEREKAALEAHGKLVKEVGQMWDAHIKPEAVPDSHKAFILPKEGDAEGNAMLENGYKRYDEVANIDARNPHLSTEQRKEIISRAAAMRHRAASQPRLVHWLKQRDARIAELEESLKAFEASEPGAGDGKTAADEVAAGGSTMDQAMSALERRAKQPEFH
jgi:hypothetical protein